MVLASQVAVHVGGQHPHVVEVVGGVQSLGHLRRQISALGRDMGGGRLPFHAAEQCGDMAAIAGRGCRELKRSCGKHISSRQAFTVPNGVRWCVSFKAMVPAGPRGIIRPHMRNKHVFDTMVS